MWPRAFWPAESEFHSTKTQKSGLTKIWPSFGQKWLLLLLDVFGLFKYQKKLIFRMWHRAFGPAESEFHSTNTQKNRLTKIRPSFGRKWLLLTLEVIGLFKYQKKLIFRMGPRAFWPADPNSQDQDPKKRCDQDMSEFWPQKAPFDTRCHRVVQISEKSHFLNVTQSILARGILISQYQDPKKRSDQDMAKFWQI